MPTTTARLAVDAVKHFQAQRFAECISVCEEVLQTDERNTSVLRLAAQAAFKALKPVEAVAYQRNYLAQEEGDADGWYVLGMYEAGAGNAQESFLAHQTALRLDNNHVNAAVNLGLYMSRAGRFEEALSLYRHASELAPTDPVVHNNYANVLKNAGLREEAIQMYKRTLNLQPNLAGALSNQCYLTQFDPQVSLSGLYEQHKQWDERFCKPHEYEWADYQNVKDPERPLRVGFISEDFRHHTVGHYLLPVLQNLPEDIEVYCYSLTGLEDDFTEEFRAVAGDCFYNMLGKADYEFRDIVRADTIDVLFDLSGHTSGNRLEMMSRKPAPIQMTWLGYVGTTGLSAIDYKIASNISAPVGTEVWYSEDILRFPEPYAHQCFVPNYAAPDIGEPPSLEAGYITFGTFSNIIKLNPTVINVWSQILLRTPESKLLLKSAAYASEWTQGRITKAFGAHGVEPDRILFEPFTPPPECFSTYNKIDVVLDPWPFSGCTTTCEALWMGVPVVTWPQQTEASRHTASFLTALGLVNGVAYKAEQYIEMAADLGRNQPYRAYLRKTLRDKMRNSPMCDAAAYGSMLGSMIRNAWRKWCE